MAEPDWMPSYTIELWEGGFKNRLLETVAAKTEREADAVSEATSLLDRAWKPGPRKQRRCRPIIAVVIRQASSQSEEVVRLTWTLDGVVDSSNKGATHNL